MEPLRVDEEMKLAIPDTGREVPAGKLLCIGRNYALHAAEMQSILPTEPVVFLKPATALIQDGEAVVLPAMSRDVHHEVELVVMIGRPGKHIAQSDALSHIAGYAVGLDMTARDLQSAAKKGGRPWSIAKGFDTFAPVGAFVSATQVRDPQDLVLTLAANGQERQRGHTRDMIFPVAELIAYCSRIFTLEPGDLLLTGTPHGVGSVQDGDTLVATCSGLPVLTVPVRRARQATTLVP